MTTLRFYGIIREDGKKGKREGVEDEMETVAREVTRDTKFVYSVKPKLTVEEILDVKYAALGRGIGVGQWIAEAIRRRLVSDNVRGKHSPA